MKVFDPGVPCAILKADDLGMGGGIGQKNFRRLFAMISQRQLCISVGAVGDLVGALPHQEQAFLRGVFEDDSFELWNHSHRHPDLTKHSRDHQRADTLRAQDSLTTALGQRPRIYGAPYNRVNADTISVLEECGEFDGAWMLDPVATRLATIPLTHLCTPETVHDTTRQPEFEPFLTRWKSRATRRPTVVQFHPTAWNDEGFEAFGRCLDWLIATNVRFLTFAEAIALGAVAAAPVGDAPLTTPPRVLTLAADIQAEAVVSSLPAEYFVRLSREFFATRYQLGTQRPMRALEKSGILQPLQTRPVDAPGRVLDIGFGVGNWMIAAASLVPGAEVHGVDPHPGCAAITCSVLENLSFGHRIIARAAAAEHLPYPDAHFQAAYCINSVNYMDVPAALSAVWRVLAPRSMLAINTQTRAYFLGDAKAALERGLVDAARSRLETLAYQAAFSLGFTRTPIRTRSYQAPDVFRMLRLLGFDVLVERAALEEGVSVWRGETFVDAFVAERSSDRLRNVRGLLARPGGPTSLEMARQMLHLGCHALLIETLDLGILERAALAEHDLPTLAAMALGQLDVEATTAAEKGLRTPHGRTVLRLQQRDWAGAIAASADSAETDLAYLGAIARYLAGDYVGALAECKPDQCAQESRFAYLAAATACHLQQLDLAKQVTETGRIVFEPRDGTKLSGPFIQAPGGPIAA